MTAYTSALLLLVISSSSHGFNTGRSHSGRTRPRTTMPPLFYTDIEPEIRSITIPPVIHFNGTSILVGSSANRVKEDRTVSKDDREIHEPSTSTKAYVEAGSKKPKIHKNHKVVWQTRYNELKSYKEENGHCLVPQNYRQNPKLGLWVMQQRRQFTLQQNGKRSSLNGTDGQRRVKLLEDIGFVWKVERRGPRGAYGSLRRMKHHADIVKNNGSGDEIQDAVDFEKYIVQKREKMSDAEVRMAWHRRFEMFQ